MDREIIFYLGILGTLIYMIYIIYMQKISNKRRNNEIAFANSEYEIADENFKLIKEKLLKSVSEIHGHKKAEQIAQGIIWISMPKHLLLVAKGKAYDIKESIYKDIVIEKWYYGEYINR